MCLVVSAAEEGGAPARGGGGGHPSQDAGRWGDFTEFYSDLALAAP